MRLNEARDRYTGEIHDSDVGVRSKSNATRCPRTAASLDRASYDEAIGELVRVIRLSCRRKRVSYDEEADFTAWVVLRLLETDYALFKKFQGRGELGSYLATAVERLLLDYRISKWGKFTPSTLARCLGKEAVALERYTYRDGFTPEEAVKLVKTNLSSGQSEERLSDVLRRLPVRHRAAQNVASLDAVEPPATERDNPERQLIGEEVRAERRDARKVLIAAIERLSTPERVMLRLHFLDGMKLREIARRRAYPEAKLYRDFARLKKRLREQLRANGIEYRRLTECGSDDPDHSHGRFLDEVLT